MATTAPFPSAIALRDAMASGELGATGVISDTLERIARLDDDLNAFVTLDPDGAMARARELDAIEPAAHGPLHGVPVAIKDLTDTAGLRTTYGSKIFRDHVPQQDDHVVARLKAAGAIIIGKSNTPEFGFGAVCANAVAGITRNPFALSLTSGGSSGGSAVAVASGMVPLAHGTDFGGSVRTPASFCGIFALRPTVGAIASPARSLGWDRLATHGVMARSASDCAAMFAAVMGPDSRDPTSFVPQSPRNDARPRIAQTVDFGVAPLSSEVRRRFRLAVESLSAQLGAIEEAQVDCSMAASAFRTLRAAHVHHNYAHLLESHTIDLMPTARWNIEAGNSITAAKYLAADAQRTTLYRNFVRLFEHIDVLVAPAASVMPWPVEDGEVSQIDGQDVGDVLDYLAPTYIVSLTGFPVLTIPTPLNGPDDLPFGVQLIGRPGSDLDLLELGSSLEETGFRFVEPPGVRHRLPRG